MRNSKRKEIEAEWRRIVWEFTIRFRNGSQAQFERTFEPSWYMYDLLMPPYEAARYFASITGREGYTHNTPTGETIHYPAHMIESITFKQIMETDDEN